MKSVVVEVDGLHFCKIIISQISDRALGEYCFDHIVSDIRHMVISQVGERYPVG